MTDEDLKILQSNLAKVEKSVADLDKSQKSLITGGTTEHILNRRGRFAEHGNWARHYSTVRMTVTTFLVSLSIGILSFKWEPTKGQPNLKFIDLAAGVWVAALFLFLIFTHHTYREMANARRLRRLLPSGDNKPSSRKKRHPIHTRQDSASWILIILTAVFALLLLRLANIRFAKPTWPALSVHSAGHFISIYIPAMVLSAGLWAAIYTAFQEIPDDGTPRIVRRRDNTSSSPPA